MASLFLVGNVNERTFANAALAAHVRDCDRGGRGLTDVFVLHSPESEQHLAVNTEWREHLAAHGLSHDIFVSCTVALHGGQDEQLNRVARHIERFILALDAKEDIYVDLTNGPSLYKSILSNVSYILGVRKQFILDTREIRGFLGPDKLRDAYVELPSPSGLDAVAPAWLTEVRRFNVKARETSQTLAAICGIDSARRVGLEGDIENAVRAWFRGEKSADGAALGGAVRYAGRAFEDLIRGVHEVLFNESDKRHKNLSDMLDQICSRLTSIAPGYEPQLIEDISQLLRRLRNTATHEQISPEFGRIRARLSTELLLATADYLKILHETGLLNPAQVQANHERNRYSITGRAGQAYYFGLDGDDTGRGLEHLFQSASDAEPIARFSIAIENAMKAVAASASKAPIQGKVLFRSGDDILFRGTYDADAIEELRAIYTKISGGRTCCVGFGSTLKEAYVAIKMAKAAPGKDCVMGVELVSQDSESGLSHSRQG